MGIYQLDVRERTGLKSIRIVIADSPGAAVRELADDGLFVQSCRELRARPIGGLRALSLGLWPIDAVDRALFFRHLGALVKAGHATGAALSRMGPRLADPRLRWLAIHAALQVQQDRPLSQVLAMTSGYFPSWVWGSVGAAERSGNAEEIYPSIARDLDRAAEWDYRFSLPRWLFRCFLIGFFVLSAVAADIFSPPVRLGDLAAHAGLASLLVVLLFCWAGRWLSLLPSSSELAQRLSAAVPGLGSLRQAAGLGRFFGTLRSLYRAGLAFPFAFADAIPAVGVSSLISRLTAGREMFRGGGSFLEAFQACRCFPMAVLDGVRQGEARGHIGEMIDWLCEYYDASRAEAEKRALRLAWIGLVIIAAVLLGFLALQGYGKLAIVGIRQGIEIMGSWVQ